MIESKCNDIENTKDKEKFGFKIDNNNEFLGHNYKDIIKLINHYKALGITKCALDNDDKDIPWDKCQYYENNIREDKYIDYTFYAEIEGIIFYWGCFFALDDMKKIKVTINKIKSKMTRKHIISTINNNIERYIKDKQRELESIQKNISFLVGYKKKVSSLLK